MDGFGSPVVSEVLSSAASLPGLSFACSGLIGWRASLQALIRTCHQREPSKFVKYCDRK